VRGEDTGTIIAHTPSSVAVGGGQGGGCFTEGATIQNQQMETLQSNPVRSEDTGTIIAQTPSSVAVGGGQGGGCFTEDATI